MTTDIIHKLEHYPNWLKDEFSRMRARIIELELLLPQSQEELNKLKRNAYLRENLMQIVSDITGVSVDAIKNGGRKENVAMARHIYMYCSNILSPHKPLRKIAKEVNRTDHSTVIYAIKKIDMHLNSQFNTEYDTEVREFIYGILNFDNNKS